MRSQIRSRPANRLDPDRLVHAITEVYHTPMPSGQPASAKRSTPKDRAHQRLRAEALGHQGSPRVQECPALVRKSRLRPISRTAAAVAAESPPGCRPERVLINGEDGDTKPRAGRRAVICLSRGEGVSDMAIAGDGRIPQPHHSVQCDRCHGRSDPVRSLVQHRLHRVNRGLYRVADTADDPTRVH
jgi:hypothetical protein